MSSRELSVSQITTLHVELRRRRARLRRGRARRDRHLGDEARRRRDAEALELLEASGLGAATAVPAVPSILPLPLLGGPDDPQSASTRSARSLERLARYAPAGDRLPHGHRRGPRPRRGARHRRRTACATIGARRSGRPADRARAVPADGVESWTIVSSIPEAVELIERRRRAAGLGIQFDVWHLWNTPTLYDDIAARAPPHRRRPRVRRREPTRGWADRVLPARESQTSGHPRARSTTRAGTASTTSRSSPTTAPSATRIPTRSGQPPPAETLARARAAFEQTGRWSADPPGRRGDNMRRRSSRAGLIRGRRRGRARCARGDCGGAHDGARRRGRS